MMKGITMNQIESVSDLIKMIEDNTNVYPSSKFLYRGESKTDYRLLPSLLRKTVINGKEKELYQNSELQILQEFAAEASSYLPNIEKTCLNVWNMRSITASQRDCWIGLPIR